MALVQLSKQPNAQKCLKEGAKSHLGSSSRESQKSLSHRPNPVSDRGKLPKRRFAPCKRLFWESRPGGQKTPFAPSSIGNGKRGHYERGLFTGGISRISKISKFSRISRKWSDSPLFSTVWGSSKISRISKFSRISRKWTFLKRPLFQKTPFSEPELSTFGHFGCFDSCTRAAESQPLRL